MADLDGPKTSAAIDSPAEQKGSADAAADREVKQGRATLSRTETCLGKTCGVGVVVDHDDRDSEGPGKPVLQRKTGPTFDLIRKLGSSLRHIHRATKADTRASDLAGGKSCPHKQRVESSYDLSANRGGPECGIHSTPLQRQQIAVRPADPELKLGSTDLDPE